MKLEDCRRKIDRIDAQIVSLLNERAAVARNVGVLKAGAGLPIVDSEREEEILRRVLSQKKGEIEDDSIVRIFRSIILESRRVQAGLVVETLEKETQTR